MSKDLVTVIIPSYNHVDYVGAAIEGLIAQTHKNIELIILDDGSDDSSVNIIESFSGQCRERFVGYTFIQNKRLGLANSLNMGVNFARGEYILINASDDFAEPIAVERMLSKMISDSKIAIVACNNAFIDEFGRRSFWDKNQNNVYAQDKAVATNFIDWLQRSRIDFDLRSDEFGSYERLLGGNHLPNGYLQRKSHLYDVGNYESIALEDWPMHLKLARKYRIVLLDEILFNYRWHGSNTILDVKFGFPMTIKVLAGEKKFALANGYARKWIRVYCVALSERIRFWRRWLITLNIASRRRQIRLFGFYLLAPPSKDAE